MFPKFPDSVDVLVVGLGPAGSAICKTCAKTGLNVLGVEKRPEIGAPKRCAEGLSKGSLERIGIDYSDRWARQPIHGARVYAPNGKFVEVNYNGPEGWIVDRKVFDKFLAVDAVNAGAKVFSNAEVVSLIKEDEKVVGAKIEFDGEVFEVRAKIVVASDGVESKIAREAGLMTNNKQINYTSGAQFEMAGLKLKDENFMELFFGTDIASGGYVWIFPKGDGTANVGIGIRKPWAKKTALEYLQKFVEKHPGLKDGSIVEVNAGGVPVGGLLKDMVLDNFVVVGDAAHHVNPIHGGGISEAYVGGRIAGEVVSEAIKSGDTSKEFLSKYNEKWWEVRGNKLQKVEKLRKVVESLSNDDLDWLVDFLKGEDLIEFSKSLGFKKLAKILMKRPRLALLARKLL